MYLNSDELAQEKTNNGLGYYPFQNAVVCSMGAFGKPYEDCICGILEYANWNFTDDNGNHPCRYNVGFKKSTCFTADEVEEVINAYHALIDKNEIPEYEYAKPSSVAVLQAISQISMKDYNRVKMILDSLTWATQNRKINGAWCLFPKSYNTTKQYQENTDTANSGQAQIGGIVKKIADTVDTTISTAKIIIYIAVGAAVVVGGVYVYSFLPKPNKDKK